MDQLTKITPETYTPEKGKYIAECFAAGDSLRDICEHSNGWLPAMLYVRRWRSMYPAFDSLMIEAQACRAENMAEDMLAISDDTSQQAAHNRNRMTAREKIAGWLAPASYGDRKAQEKPQDADGMPIYALTDEQLLMIAAGKVAPALEGECERLTNTGVHPPTRGEGTARSEVSGSKESRSISYEPSVTTNSDIMEAMNNEWERQKSLPENNIVEVRSEKLPDVFFEDNLLPPETEKKSQEPGDADRVRRSFIGME